MPKPTSSAQQFTKRTARLTWTTLFVVAILFGGVALAVFSFSGPPPGCTPTSCPKNPFKVDFTNSKVKIGEGLPAGQTRLEVNGNMTATGDLSGAKVSAPQLCIGSECKTAWPSTAPVAGAGQYKIGNMIWSGEQGNKTYDQAVAHCVALAPAGTWYLPTIADWDKAKGIKGGAAGLRNALGLSNSFYRTSSLSGNGVDNFYAYVYSASSGYWYSNDAGYFNESLPVRRLQNS